MFEDTFSESGQQRQWRAAMKHVKEESLSIRQAVTAALLAGMVVILSTLAFNTEYATKKMKEETSEQYLNILKLRQNSIENNLSSAAAGLVSYSFSGSHISNLLSANTRSAAYVAEKTICGDFDNQLFQSTASEMAFVRKHGDGFDSFRITLSATARFSTREKLNLEAYVASLNIKESGTGFSWRPCQIGNEWYFLYVISDGSYVIGQGIRAKTIVDMYAIVLDENSSIVILNDENAAMLDVSDTTLKNVAISNGNKEARTTILGNKIVVSTYSHQLARPIFFIKEKLFSQNYERVISLLRATTILIFGVYLWMFNRLSRAVLKPLKKLKKGIAEICNGNLESRIDVDAGSPQEFRAIYSTLNEMAERIKTLKIDGYENKLRWKQYEIQFLTLQIEPHFYLNSMKYLYALAQTKQYEKLKAIILTLSGYFRYLTYDSGKKAALQQELEHVKYYVDIINAGSTEQVNITFDADTSAEQVPVPKLLVQTFVENAVKHGTVSRKSLNIRVSVRIFGTGGEEFIRLRVSDDGCGFSESFISEIKKNGFCENTNHIKLFNLYSRLNLLYPDGQVFMGVDNNESGGAVAEVIMPIIWDDLTEGERQ